MKMPLYDKRCLLVAYGMLKCDVSQLTSVEVSRKLASCSIHIPTNPIAVAIPIFTSPPTVAAAEVGEQEEEEEGEREGEVNHARAFDIGELLELQPGLVV